MMGNMLAQQVGSRSNQFSYSGTTSKLTQVSSTDALAGTITYDAAGNEIAITNVAAGSAPNNVDAFTYSARNELIGVSRPTNGTTTLPTSIVPGSVPNPTAYVPVGYKYDGFGTRLTTTVNTYGPNVSGLPGVSVLAKRYSIPGPDGELATETSITNPGKAAYDYIWMGGKPIAQVDTAGIYYDFTDHLNAPIIQTNASGAIAYWADYEPYGKIYGLRPRYSNLHQPIRFPGQVAEQFENGANGATDLSYNNARWYRPEWGRYAESDPIGLFGGDNPFRYAGDAPVDKLDPSGLDSVLGLQPFDPTPAGRGMPSGLRSTYATTICEGKCAVTAFDDAIGLGVATGPWIPKSRAPFAGGSSNTSIAGIVARQLFPQHFPSRVPAPTAGNLGSTTRSVGGALGRWLALANIPLSFYDEYKWSECVSICVPSQPCPFSK